MPLSRGTVTNHAVEHCSEAKQQQGSVQSNSCTDAYRSKVLLHICLSKLKWAGRDYMRYLLISDCKSIYSNRGSVKQEASSSETDNIPPTLASGKITCTLLLPEHQPFTQTRFERTYIWGVLCWRSHSLVHFCTLSRDSAVRTQV